MKTVQIPLHGGTGDAVGLLVRDAGPHTAPTVLVRTPYPRLGALLSNYGFALAGAGYSVVIQSVRGRHGSAGRFVPFVHEEADGLAAIEWCAKQPWCDGRMFLTGKSYEGLAAWAACRALHPAVVGICVSMTAACPIDWFYEGGAFRQSFAQSWGISLAYTNPLNEKATFELIRSSARDLRNLYSTPPEQSPLVDFLEGYSDWIVPPRLSSIVPEFAPYRNVPIHMVTGWHDIFLEGALKDMRGVTMRADRLIIGPWSHDTIGERLVGSVDYGVNATRGEFDVQSDVIQWMNSILSADVTGGTSYYDVITEDWEHIEKWPPPTEPYSLDLQAHSSNTAANGYQLADRELRIRRDLYLPTPGGRVHDPLLPHAGGYDFESLLAKPACVSLATSPLKEKIELIGTVTLHLTVRHEHSCIYVAWVGCKLPSRSYRCLGYGVISSDGSFDNQHIRIDASSIAASIPRDSVLLVAISCSSWPEFHGSSLSLSPATIVLSDRASLTLSVEQISR